MNHPSSTMDLFPNKLLSIIEEDTLKLLLGGALVIEGGGVAWDSTGPCPSKPLGLVSGWGVDGEAPTVEDDTPVFRVVGGRFAVAMASRASEGMAMTTPSTFGGASSQRATLVGGHW